jgi:hypothetical protein
MIYIKDYVKSKNSHHYINLQKNNFILKIQNITIFKNFNDEFYILQKSH